LAGTREATSKTWDLTLNQDFIYTIYIKAKNNVRPNFMKLSMKASDILLNTSFISLIAKCEYHKLYQKPTNDLHYELRDL
jgi:hypothetical protein